ncbi:MAG: short-chain dehydrogenase/reductase, partial [Trebonia sp.]
EAEMRYLFDLHYFGPAALTKAALPHMRRQGSGWVVQFSSVGGSSPHRGSAPTAPPNSPSKASLRP